MLFLVGSFKGISVEAACLFVNTFTPTVQYTVCVQTFTEQFMINFVDSDSRSCTLSKIVKVNRR